MHNIQYIKKSLIVVQTWQLGQVGGSVGVVIVVTVSVGLSIYNLC